MVPRVAAWWGVKPCARRVVMMPARASPVPAVARQLVPKGMMIFGWLGEIIVVGAPLKMRVILWWWANCSAFFIRS